MVTSNARVTVSYAEEADLGGLIAFVMIVQSYMDCERHGLCHGGKPLPIVMQASQFSTSKPCHSIQRNMEEAKNSATC